MKKPEKESVVITDECLNGQNFKKVVMIISAGKLICLIHALEDKAGDFVGTVTDDLLQMVKRADAPRA
jgi:hypothetical protein